MAATAAISSPSEVQAFFSEYFGAWQGTAISSVGGHGHGRKGCRGKPVRSAFRQRIPRQPPYSEEHDFRGGRSCDRVEFRSRTHRPVCRTSPDWFVCEG